LTDARLPEALAVAVPVRGALGGLLVQAGADLRGDLGLHELADEPGERLAQDVGMVIAHELAYELVQTHAHLGHRGAPLVDLCNGSDDSAAHGGRSLPVLTAQDLRMKVKLW